MNNNNDAIIARIKGMKAQAGTPETDADPRNPIANPDDPRIAALEAENAELRRVCAELYQIIGTMAEYCPDPEAAPIIKALDNASDAASGDPVRHQDLLPFVLDHAASERVALRARLAEAERVMRPFAEAADYIEGQESDRGVSWQKQALMIEDESFNTVLLPSGNGRLLTGNDLTTARAFLAGEKPKIKLRFEWKGTHCFVGPVRVGRVMSESGEYAGWIFETLIKWFPTESEARAYVEAIVTAAIMGAME